MSEVPLYRTELNGVCKEVWAGDENDATFSTFYLTESVWKAVLQNSIPAQIRQLILYYY